MSNTSGFEEFVKELNCLKKDIPEKTLRAAGKELGGNLAKNTPVYEGNRDDGPTGQLKSEWFGGEHNVNVGNYVDRMPIKKDGKDYQLTFENKATNSSGQMFATYVEEGHKQEVGRYVAHNDVNARLVRPFIDGLKFAEKSVLETEQVLQHVIDNAIKIELKGYRS